MSKSKSDYNSQKKEQDSTHFIVEERKKEVGGFLQLFWWKCDFLVMHNNALQKQWQIEDDLRVQEFCVDVGLFKKFHLYFRLFTRSAFIGAVVQVQ